MITVTAEVRHYGNRLMLLARGLTALTGGAEVIVSGAANRMKAANLRAMGRDPMAVPPPIAQAARDDIRRAIMSADVSRISRVLLRAAQSIRDFLKRRITTGRLGTNTPGGKRIKRDLVLRGLATAAYGVPPPFGVCTGRLVNSIQARRRAPSGR